MSTIELTSADGHRLAAWQAQPTAAARAGIVVVQEIFGVNNHIRAVTDGFAADGYLAVAPAFFDRIERGYETGYSPADISAGRERVARLDPDQTLADLRAAVAAVQAQLGPGGKVGVVGYCWGGTVAWLAATRDSGAAAAVAYYGGGIPTYASESPRVPVLLQFGEQDSNPSPETGRAIAEREAERVRLHLYPAGHGFNCDLRPSYHAESARLARQRTLEFFATWLAA